MDAGLTHRGDIDRLAVLDAYGILDTPHEKAFDDVALLVSQLLKAPIAAVNLIAETRQWFKAEVGLNTREMPLDDSICKFALLQEDLMVVPDTRLDSRFNCNPLVTGAPGLRFYAGELLKTRDGVALGTLCVLDTEPRPQGLSAQERFILSTLAQQVMSQIELRRALREQRNLLLAQQRIQHELEQERDQGQRLLHGMRQADQRKDEFLAMLAHELRNPLAPITSAAATLGARPADESIVRNTSAIIARQARHMTGLIDDLLDVSRVTRGKVELDNVALDAKDVIADAVEQVRPLIEKHAHRLVLDLSPAPSTVFGDRKRLVQVMTNLLSNAAKYTPDGGNIALVLESHHDTLVIRVSDDGIGMTPELRASAFELFSQGARGLDRSQGGLGIGLALVKSLLHLHGGTVSVHSDGPGHGSTFEITLPRLASVAPTMDTAPHAPVQLQAGALRIAVVDDNEDAAATLAMFLEASGHLVSISLSSQHALACLPAFEPDVCLLDIGLPGMNGFELARALRAAPATAGAMLVAVTGYAQEKDRQDALAAGFDELFAKPVDLAVLEAALARAAQRRPLAA